MVLLLVVVGVHVHVRLVPESKRSWKHLASARVLQVLVTRPYVLLIHVLHSLNLI